MELEERQRTEARTQLARDVLAILNRPGVHKDAVHDVVHAIQHSTGFQAVGIRLKEGDDFPYYDISGFPGAFVQMERDLCARDDTGSMVRDANGNAVLECMCGNVLCGRTDPKLPYFTDGGSFWTNSTTELLASTTEEDSRRACATGATARDTNPWR